WTRRDRVPGHARRDTHPSPPATGAARSANSGPTPAHRAAAAREANAEDKTPRLADRERTAYPPDCRDTTMATRPSFATTRSGSDWLAGSEPQNRNDRHKASRAAGQ